MSSEKLNQLRLAIRAAYNGSFYHQKFNNHGIIPEDIETLEAFRKIPFTSKEELREAYPLKLQAVPDKDVIRIHSSSGTTGVPVIIPYTSKDVSDWAIMMKRCYEFAGVTNEDRVQITPGYGLWTAGIGFQAGAENLGAMVIPTGPGNTEKQLQMLVDMQSTVLTATSSYALLLAEEIAKRNLNDKIKLRTGIIGSERWGEKMRDRIITELGLDAYDIYGLTEVYGPGISIDCAQHNGLHYWDDYLYFEIIDPVTGEILPDGEYGELVITTLFKEAAPLIRFRTRDITRLIPGECPCGSKFPRHDRISGRSDDMIKVKGVNIFPSQVDTLLKTIEGASSEYQIQIDHVNGRDIITLKAESDQSGDKNKLSSVIQNKFKTKIGIQVEVEVLNMGELPRSEKKTKRVIDNRGL